MPRQPSEPARLEALEAVRTGLPRKKLLLNMSEMAKVAQMTLRGFKLLVERDATVPVEKRGGEGVPYEFDARKVLEHLIGSARAAQAARERQSAEVSRLAGLGGSPEATPAGASQAGGSGTAAQMLAEARALEAVLDLRAKVRAERIKDGSLLERSAVETFLWRWLSSMQAEVLSIEQRLDRTGRLEPAQRQVLKDELAAILVAMRGRLEQFIGQRDGSGPQADRAGGRRARSRSAPVPDRGSRRAGAGAAHPA